ncbi:hypothetical protein K3495_g11786 [Podosphaera aphanis]|nr:hypothetical protein K3495_g11786 [Podosphaera aphanis]
MRPGFLAAAVNLIAYASGLTLSPDSSARAVISARSLEKKNGRVFIRCEDATFIEYKVVLAQRKACASLYPLPRKNNDYPRLTEHISFLDHRKNYYRYPLLENDILHEGSEDEPSGNYFVIIQEKECEFAGVVKITESSSGAPIHKLCSKVRVHGKM